jgi:diguanylate cyclase (GGDEF)-like protein
MSDLDGLKYINDNFGHADGDHSIAKVADALKEAVPENALSARFGGDELFSVIIGECDVDAIVEKIDGILADFNKTSNLPYTVTTSSGAYTTELTPDYEVLKALKVADEKMYTVKNHKRRARMGSEMY